MSGWLTTHVLDTTRGVPAAGVHIQLSRLSENGAKEVIGTSVTGSDGRTQTPLLEGEAFVPGTYLLEFKVGDYFDDGFWDVIPVRFRISEKDAHYHVPLLCSPWAYSTYRGS